MQQGPVRQLYGDKLPPPTISLWFNEIQESMRMDDLTASVKGTHDSLEGRRSEAMSKKNSDF